MDIFTRFFRDIDDKIKELPVAEASSKTLDSKNSNNTIETYYAIALSLLSYINRWNLTERIIHLIDVSKLMRIDSFESWKEAGDYLSEMSRILYNIQEEASKKQTNNTIQYIQEYIVQHLDEDLSLAKLAEEVYLNASYLSRLYKQTTGINLSEYIENSRIQRAKELLEKSDRKIKDIARQVGYETAASFTRVFKKATGSSPQDFRRQK